MVLEHCLDRRVLVVRDDGPGPGQGLDGVDVVVAPLGSVPQERLLDLGAGSVALAPERVGIEVVRPCNLADVPDLDADELVDVVLLGLLDAEPAEGRPDRAANLVPGSGLDEHAVAVERDRVVAHRPSVASVDG